MCKLTKLDFMARVAFGNCLYPRPTHHVTKSAILSLQNLGFEQWKNLYGLINHLSLLHTEWTYHRLIIANTNSFKFYEHQNVQIDLVLHSNIP